MSRVVVLSLGRDQAMGEVRRVASWRQLFTAAGADVSELTVSTQSGIRLDGLGAIARGSSPPERAAWRGAPVRAELARLDADLVVVVSTRAFDPHVVRDCRTVVLDQVDGLARSYRDRATVVDGFHRRIGYSALARMHERVERKVRGLPVRRVAAGWNEAAQLGAEWVPNLVDPELVAPVDAPAPDTDLLFFGTLRYPPNVDALERLAGMWPAITRARPGTSLLVAGSAPGSRVRDLCGRHGWELLPDFPSLPAVAARTRLAVAPLRHVAGLQNKVLDAGALGLPQVVSPAALEGFAPGLPLEPAADDAAFVDEVLRLLDDPLAATAAGQKMRTAVLDHYGVEAWLPWARALLDHGVR